MPGTSGPEALTADKWPHTVPEPAVSMRSRPCVRAVWTAQPFITAH